MDPDDIVQRNDRLDEQIAGSSSIHALEQASRRSRRMIHLLAFSLAFDILLSIGLGVLALRANQLAIEANSIEERARSTCLSSNEARAGQMQLWHHVLDLPPTAPRTAAQQQQADQFGRYVDNLFAPRKC